MEMNISDGVKVLILTICGYTFSYSYYFGYYSAKNIPFEFIDISLLSMVRIGFGTCAILSFFLYWLELLDYNAESSIGLDINTKRFLVRHFLGIITMILFTANMVMSDKWSILFPTYFIWYVCLKKDINVAFRDPETKRIRPRITIKPLKELTSTIVAEKFNIKIYYVYFSWYLGLLFLLFNIGGVFSHMLKETLVCNNDIHVVKVGEADVLVTKDYNHFQFKDKKDCTFSAPSVK
nr:hypothetical protein [Enterobacter bugandensis]